MRNCPIERSRINRGSVVLKMAVKFSPVAIVLLHSGDGKIRLVRLISFPCNIFALRRAEMFADCGMYGLPAAGAGTAEAKEYAMVSLGRVDVCVPVSAKETCGTLMFAEYEAALAAFSRFSSRLSMLCKVLARDCRVVVKIFAGAEVGAETKDVVAV